jgi:hypothetical protein
VFFGMLFSFSVRGIFCFPNHVCVLDDWKDGSRIISDGLSVARGKNMNTTAACPWPVSSHEDKYNITLLLSVLIRNMCM